jgi:hypothetical protein
MSDDSPDPAMRRYAARSVTFVRARELGGSRTGRGSLNEALPSARRNPARDIDCPHEERS